MNKSHSMRENLMAQDSVLNGEEYEYYRRTLHSALENAGYRERLAQKICMVSGVISFSLMFVGASRAFGSFDPWDQTATPLSMGLAVIYLASSILFWVLLASYYSRFRPNTRSARESIRDEQILQLERSVAEIRDWMLALQCKPVDDVGQSTEHNSDADS